MKGKFKQKRNKTEVSEPQVAVSADALNEQVENVTAEESAKTDVEVQLDELAATPSLKKQRIWEVDFVRGLMILFVVWDHFMWDVSSIGTATFNSRLFTWLYDLSNTYYGGTLRSVTHDVFVTMFVFTSGISCSFSRNNGKRALKMIIFACLLTAVTYAISAIINASLTMYFNVIHVIALSVLLWTVIEWCWGKCSKNWKKNIFGCVMFAVTLTVLIVGYCAKYDFNTKLGNKPWETSPALYFLLYSKGNTFIYGGDFLPFFPDFGWFLVGAFLGRAIYRERKSIFPSVNPKFVCPVTFCGRYSIWVYFGSQVLMFGLIYLFHVVWNVM